METRRFLKGFVRLMLALIVTCGVGLVMMGTEVKAATINSVTTDGDKVTVTLDEAVTAADGQKVYLFAGSTKVATKTIAKDGTTAEFTAADIIAGWDSGITLASNVATLKASLTDDASAAAATTVNTKKIYKIAGDSSAEHVTSVTLSAVSNTNAKVISNVAFAYAGASIKLAPSFETGYEILDWTTGGYPAATAAADGSITMTVADTPGDATFKPTAKQSATYAIKINPESTSFTADGADHKFTAELWKNDAKDTTTTVSWAWTKTSEVDGITATFSGADITLKSTDKAGTPKYTITATYGGKTLSKEVTFTVTANTKPAIAKAILVAAGNTTDVTGLGSPVRFAADGANHGYELRLLDASNKDITSSYTSDIAWDKAGTSSGITWTTNGKTINVKASDTYGTVKLNAKVGNETKLTVEFTSVSSIGYITLGDGTTQTTIDADGTLKTFDIKVLDKNKNDITAVCTLEAADVTSTGFNHKFDATKKQSQVYSSKAGDYTVTYTAKTIKESAGVSGVIMYKFATPKIAVVSFYPSENEVMVGTKVTFSLDTNIQPKTITFYPTGGADGKKKNGKKITVKSGTTSYEWVHTYSSKGEYDPWVEVTDSAGYTADATAAVDVIETLGIKITNTTPIVLTCGQTVNVTGKLTDDVVDEYDAAKYYELTTTKTGYLKEGTPSLDSKNNTITIPMTSEKTNEAYTSDDLKVYIATTDDEYESDNSAVVHIYKKASCTKTTNSGTTQSATFFVPTHVGTIKTTNMTVTGYKIKIYKDSNCVKTMDAKDGTGDKEIKLDDIMSAIGSVASGDSYTFKLAIQPVGKINNTGDVVDAKTVDSSNNEIDYVSDLSNEFTVYRVNLTADTGITVAADRTWGVAGQKVGIKATGTVGYWTKNGVKIDGSDAKQSIEATISTTVADNKIGAVVGTATPAAGGAAATGSTAGLDDVPKTAESNAPIWLIVVLVFAAMGGGYALYMQMKPVKAEGNSAKSPFFNDDDYDDNF